MMVVVVCWNCAWSSVCMPAGVSIAVWPCGVPISSQSTASCNCVQSPNASSSQQKRTVLRHVWLGWPSAAVQSLVLAHAIAQVSGRQHRAGAPPGSHRHCQNAVPGAAASAHGWSSPMRFQSALHALHCWETHALLLRRKACRRSLRFETCVLLIWAQSPYCRTFGSRKFCKISSSLT